MLLSKRILFAALAISLPGLNGCQTVIHKSANIAGVQTLSIDAKQRMLLVTNKGGRLHNETVACAEPSPDALAAQAAALSASGAKPEVISAALSASRSESAASIGLRTQTIQILRDGYYRICEAYMNGAINSADYKKVISHVDGVIAVVMAIDALGGTVSAPAIAISAGKSTAGTTGSGVNATIEPATLSIVDFSPERGSLSDAQAQAIENVVRMYLLHKQKALRL